ncbi:MAG: Uncharacterised protein [SAR116 cluster bacterium]|nr:MAG: Uncharacterised protein [SAR116 cluster bacterium]
MIFFLAQADVNAAVLLKPQTMSGHVLKLVTQGRPQFRRSHSPVSVGRETGTLALYPHKSKISPRRLEISVRRVKKGTAKTTPCQTVGDAESYQTASHNNGVVILSYVNLPVR